MTKVKNYFSLAGVAVLASAFIAQSGQAMTIELDFDNGGSIVHGQVIDNEYAGIDIWAENEGGGPDLAVAYDSDNRRNYNGRDKDLEGAPWAGGNASDTTDSGNSLIIQENSRGCGDGVCNRPDDEGSRPAGSLYIDFNQAIGW